jgi:hypothetical protein
VRKLLTLVLELPRGSRLLRRLYPKTQDWGITEELLASVLEQQAATNRLLHAAHFKPPHPDIFRLPRPSDGEPVRPSGAPERPKMASSEEVRAMFGPGAIRFVPATAEGG